MTELVDLSQEIDALKPGLIALRRALHQHPEPAFEEVWTAATLAGRMRALGLAVQEGIGGTGVLAVLEGAKPGKTLLVRADIDALAMADTTGREYASKLENRNHACGHDVHSAIVAGVAEVLVRHRDRIMGRVALVFQPADEPMRGAKRMIEDGLLERVKPDMSLSVHVLPMARVGQAVVQAGPIWASRDELTLRVNGPSPSGGAPGSFDFARTAAQITTALSRTRASPRSGTVPDSTSTKMPCPWVSRFCRWPRSTCCSRPEPGGRTRRAPARVPPSGGTVHG